MIHIKISNNIVKIHSKNMNIIETLNTQTSNFINELVRNTFIPRIAKYINERESNEVVTTDELCKVLLLPSLKLNTQSHKNTSINSNKRCVWEFKRGKSRGEVCNKQTVENSDYCSSCIKRVTFPRKLNNMNQDLTLNTITLNDLPVTGCGETPLLQAKPYDKTRGLHKLDVNSYIVRFDKIEKRDETGSDFDMYIVGKIDEDDQFIKLTTHEFEQAVEDGYLVDVDYEI